MVKTASSQKQASMAARFFRSTLARYLCSIMSNVEALGLGSTPIVHPRATKRERSACHLAFKKLFDFLNKCMKTLEPIARLVKVQNAGKPTNIIIHHYPTWADADTFPVAFTRTLGDGFPRFFMIPGMNHCRGGPEADMIDYRSCLEEWVEKEKAPDMMVGKHIEGGVAKFTRPVFPDRATSMMRPIGSPDCFQVREG